jgi:GT2 family glycosyltransferase
LKQVVLRKVRDVSRPNYEVIVIDNGSADGTRGLVERHALADPRARLVIEIANTGFAAADNRAARASEGEYLIFLNPDTMVTAGWVGRLVRLCRDRSSVGIVVPVNNFAGEARIPIDYGSAREMEWFAQALARRRAGESTEILVAPLFCALLPRTIWKEIGELDEGYQFGMFEDDDFSLRVRRSGRSILTAEDCFVYHFGQASFKKLPREQYQAIFQQNLHRFETKWNTRWLHQRCRWGVIGEARLFSPAEFV